MKNETTIYPRTNHIIFNILIGLLVISVPVIIACISHDKNLFTLAIFLLVCALLFSLYPIYSLPWITFNEDELVIHHLIPFRNRQIKWSSIQKIVPMEQCFSIMAIHGLATFIYTGKHTSYAFPMDATNIEKLHQHWAKLNPSNQTNLILYDKIPTGIIEFKVSASAVIWSCLYGLLGILILTTSFIQHHILLSILGIPMLIVAYKSLETDRRSYKFTTTHLIVNKGNGNEGLSIAWDDILNVEFCGYGKWTYSVVVLTKSYSVHSIVIRNRLSEEILEQLRQARIPLIDKPEEKICRKYSE